jgi:hypothetical protein
VFVKVTQFKAFVIAFLTVKFLWRVLASFYTIVHLKCPEILKLSENFFPALTEKIFSLSAAWLTINLILGGSQKNFFAIFTFGHF